MRVNKNLFSLCPISPSTHPSIHPSISLKIVKAFVPRRELRDLRVVLHPPSPISIRVLPIAQLLLLAPTPHRGEEVAHIHPLALHIDHPWVLQHAPGARAAVWIFLKALRGFISIPVIFRDKTKRGE